MEKMLNKIKEDIKKANVFFGRKCNLWRKCPKEIKAIIGMIVIILYIIAIAEMKDEWYMKMIINAFEFWLIVASGFLFIMVIIAIIYDNAKKIGVIGTILEMLIILILVKIVASYYALETPQLDEILQWIAKFPELLK